MFAKGVAGIAGTLLQIASEVELLAQAAASLYRLGLLAFPLPDLARDGKQFFGVFPRPKKTTVVVGKDDIAGLHEEIAEARRLERGVIARVEPLRPARPWAVTEDRQTNLSQLGRVAMRAPNDNAGEPAMLRFQGGQIADAAFIEPAAVVDHQDVARLRAVHCLKKNIDAAIMPDWKDGAGEALRGDDWLDAGAGDAKRKLEAQRGVGNERGGKIGEETKERGHNECKRKDEANVQPRKLSRSIVQRSICEAEMRGLLSAHEGG